MKRLTSLALTSLALLAFCAGGSASLAQAAARKPAPIKTSPTPFVQAAYLWTQGTDKDLNGSGDWGMYKSWLGLPALGAETDPGGWNTWTEATEGDYNAAWGDQQTRYGTAVLPDILLSIASMPYSPHGYDPAWEGRQWQLEAQNDPATMRHFVNLANNIVKWHYKSVIIRMDYEFDGGWDPYGNLNVVPGMPGSFIKAWRNIVSTVRGAVKAQDPSIRVKFLWNPTDGNVQVRTADYYPGDASVDYIGFDNYDYDYSGIYKAGVQPDTATQQRAWTDSVYKRVQWFADFASAANPYGRNGFSGRSVLLIVGEWGTWQVDPSGRPAGGDDPTYIQNMYDWMCKNNVYMESYFETPADGRSTLWPGGYPVVGSGNRSWGKSGSPYPKSAAMYRHLFGNPLPPVAPSVPGGLSAVPGYHSAALSWALSSGEPFPTYTVSRSTVLGKAGIPIASGLTGASYQDSGLQNGTAYFYAVRAESSAGTSALSAAVTAQPGIPANYAADGGFEAGDLSPWQLGAGSTPGAAYLESADSRIHTHSGSRQYTHWANAPYETGVFQDIAVANGPHTVSAWVKSGGGQTLCQMEVVSGGVKTVVPIPACPDWTQISTTVNVITGTLTVGFHSKADAGQWLNIDDVVVK